MVIKKVTTLIIGKVKVFIAVLTKSHEPPSLPQVKGMAAGTLRVQRAVRLGTAG